MVRFGVLVGCLVFLSCTVAAEAADRGLHSGSTVGSKSAVGQLSSLRLPIRTTDEPVGPSTTVPFGWEDFCRRYVGECEGALLPAVDIELTPAKWKQIDQVNRQVNEEIEPTTDMDHWGVVDQWDYPMDAKGDCEDYALLKRRLLIAAGLPRQALLLTVVRDLHGEGHAILTVKTDRGDFVLDNMTNEIEPWNATGYRFVKRQSQENPNVWLTLRGTDVPMVATTH